MKYCIRCKLKKDKNKFIPRKSNGNFLKKDGTLRTTNVCSDCVALSKKMTYKNKEMLPRYIYKHQVRNSKQRGHNAPEYTLEEFTKWIYNQNNFNILFENWEKSGYKKELIPSCDRLENSKGYSFDNIELVTFKENVNRAYNDTKNCVLGSSSRKVYQYSLDGYFIKEHISQADAQRNVPNADQRNISACCEGKINQHARFQWKHNYEGQKINPVETVNDYNRQIYKYCAFTGKLENKFNSLLDIEDDRNYIIRVRWSIREEKHIEFKQYLFDELTQEEYLSKFKIPSTKPVHAYDEKLNFLGKYESVAEASKYFDNSKSAISRSCQRKNKALTNGYSFRFFYEDEIAKQNINLLTQSI